MFLLADAFQDIEVSSVKVIKGAAGRSLAQPRNIDRLTGTGRQLIYSPVNKDTNTVECTDNCAQVIVFVSDTIRNSRTKGKKKPAVPIPSTPSFVQVPTSSKSKNSVAP